LYISKTNTENLIALNLESNFIGMTGALNLLEAIRTSKSLFQISLKKNKIPPLNGQTIQENGTVSMFIFEVLRAT